LSVREGGREVAVIALAKSYEGCGTFVSVTSMKNILPKKKHEGKRERERERACARQSLRCVTETTSRRVGGKLTPCA
jgi:hypothetical protein